MQAPDKFSILLVDDDSMVIRILSHILSDFAPLRFATSGRTALKLARESIPDLVLLDVDMPDLSGFDVCKAFKSEPPLAEVPIIFITGHESKQIEAKGLQLGAVDFISKPPHAPLVLARVRAYQRLKVNAETISTTLRNAVTLDFLTGTATRRQLEKVLAQEWLRAQRTTAPLALLLVDIHDFTAYNAEWGDDAGDSCLKALADVLRSVVKRPTDLVGRWAGGQFVILLPETGADGVSTVAQRILVAAADLPLAHAAPPGRRRLTLSVGGSYRESLRSSTRDRTPSSEQPPNDLIQAAERALHRAAAAGGSSYRLIDIAHPVAP
jgi:diguanylate cyclase (GGDEF)-like protein